MNNKIKKKNPFLAKIGLGIFGLGAVIAVAIIAVIVWANLEVFGFYHGYGTESQIRSLNCPIFMTENEQVRFSARFYNPLDYEINPTIKTIISQGSVIFVDDEMETISIPPKETIKKSWVLDSSETVYGQFVFSRVVLLNSYPLDDAEGACGVFVVNTDLLSGQNFLYLSIGLIVVLMLSGVLLWKRFNDRGYKASRNTRIALWMISATVVVGLGAGIFHFWIISGLALIAGVLLLLATATMRMTQLN